jgi:hypothetical protein
LLDETFDEITATNHQPVIIIIRDSDNLRVDQLFIKCDHRKLYLPTKDIGFCLDYFFKLFWVFNINYCPQLASFMNFFEIVLKMKIDKKKPAVNEFLLKILN